ncbi:hypothetical protein MYMA111404_04100 [Mycoplasma marinum]|nr:hypothetical protein [Mycoplasma marinum]
MKESSSLRNIFDKFDQKLNRPAYSLLTFMTILGIFAGVAVGFQPGTNNPGLGKTLLIVSAIILVVQIAISITSVYVENFSSWRKGGLGLTIFAYGAFILLIALFILIVVTLALH